MNIAAGKYKIVGFAILLSQFMRLHPIWILYGITQ